MSEWVRVDRQNPCPICEGDSWCTVSSDGRVARCMRAESEWESEGSDGSLAWVHELNEAIKINPVRLKSQSKSEKMPQLEIENIAKRAYSSPRAKVVREMLAEELEVSVGSLERMRVGAWNDEHNNMEFSSWPSRDAKGKVIGITRRYGDGSKKTMAGTSNGLFFPMERSDLEGPILILEGGSDVASATTQGLKAIGRPSNIGGIKWIEKMVKGQSCVVIGENDESPEKRGKIKGCPEDCSGCLHCAPGRKGAEIVAKKLNCSYVMPPDGAKDFREIVSKMECWFDLLKAV